MIRPRNEPSVRHAQRPKDALGHELVERLAADGFDNLRATDRVQATIGESIMIRVTANGDEPLEKTIRRFKKRCEKEGLTREIKRAAFYEKPSERRRRAMRKARKNLLKTQAQAKGL